MNQTKTSSAHSVDLEALRLQLEEDGRVYENNPDSNEEHERFLHTLQTNKYRDVITTVVNSDDLADVFVEAGYRGHVDIVEAFLNHGMNIDIKDEAGWTALMNASLEGHEKCVQFLLDHHASVDVQDEDGETALMLATMYDKTKIVEMLLEKNANLDIQNNHGMSALMLASSHGCRETVQVLLNHDADIELKDDSGKTAVDVARNEEIKEMIRNHVSASYVLK